MSGAEPRNPGREVILQTLERHRVEYVVIGGAAAQSRGWQGQTFDIDLTPERSQENLARLAGALQELGAGFRVDPQRYPDGFRPPGGLDWRTFRNQIAVTFGTPHGDLDVVLLPDGTRGYEQIIATASRERITGTDVTVPVASAEMILRSKDAADRPKDRETLPELREILDPLSPRAGHEPWSPRAGHERPRDGHEPPER